MADAAEEFDLVVAGSGAGGSAAALAGAALGLKVALVEKSPRLGGATACSLGGLWVPGNHLQAEAGLADDRAAARRYMEFLSGGSALPGNMESYLAGAAPALRFFAAAGARFRLLRGLPDHYYPDAPGTTADGRMVEAAPIRREQLGGWGERLEEGVYNVAGVSWGDTIAWGGMGAAQSWPKEELARRRAEGWLGAGPALIAQLLSRFLALGGTILAPFRAEALLQEEGRVAGLSGTDAGGRRRTLRARRGVVLATGGYEGNPELVKRFEGLPEWMNIFPPSIEGDGLVVATEIGAATYKVPNNLAMLVGYAIPAAPPYSGEQFFSAGVRGLGNPHSIVVNGAARRFCDESQFQHVVAALTRFDLGAHRYPNLPAFMLFDGRYLARYALAGRACNGTAPSWVTRSDTLAELAGALGLDAGALAATVAAFNAAAERGEDPEFGRGSSPFARATAGDATARHPNLGPLAEPPFCALRLRIGGLSAAGLLTDAEARVQHVRGRPIPGLFACGNTAAPTESGAGYQAGVSLMRGLVFGWRAAHAAAGIAAEAAA